MRDANATRSFGEIDEARELAAVERRLLSAFSPPLQPELVRRRVVEAASAWSGAPVRLYVPLLAERAARQCLRDDVARCVAEAGGELRQAG